MSRVLSGIDAKTAHYDGHGGKLTYAEGRVVLDPSSQTNV